MDMNMTSTDGGASTTATTMMTAFTTQLGASTLWFGTWNPTAVGSTFGVCVGLFFLAVFSRLLAAVVGPAESARGLVSPGAATAEARTWEQVNDTKSHSMGSASSSPPNGLAVPARPALRLARAPAFRIAVDAPLGALFALGAFVQYALMLAVMTLNAWFFIAILLGLGVGQTFFGRYSAGWVSDMVH